MFLNIVILFGFVLFSCGVNKVNGKKEELVIGLIEEDFIGGKLQYDSIIRSHVVFPENMRIAKKSRMLFYELIIGTNGRVIEKNIVNESEKEFSDEILRCLVFVESGWKVKYNSEDVNVPYKVRGKFYFELF